MVVHAIKMPPKLCSEDSGFSFIKLRRIKVRDQLRFQLLTELAMFTNYYKSTKLVPRSV